MNAIEILGSLLGGRSGSGAGAGADILSEVLGGRPKSPAPSRGRGSGPIDVERDAKSIEDMLGIGNESRPVPAQAPQRSAPPPPPAPTRPTSNVQPTDIFGQRRQAPKVSLSVPKPAELSQNDQSILLIRAMINAAKVDGEITQDEQDFILKQVNDNSAETIQFLRTEFARPINVSEFVASIPIGLERNIYMISLMAIKLDTKEEADYLRQLAKGLRISPDDSNQLHQQQQVPLIYQ